MEIWNSYLEVLMYPVKVDRNIETTESSVIRILLAESDQIRVEQVVFFLEQKFHPSVRICKRYSDLFPMMKEELPELLLLGVLDSLNSLIICRKCHEVWEPLPIIMLSRQASIEENDRRSAIAMGATDVVPNDLLHLDQLFFSLHRQPVAIANTTVTAQTILTATREITEVGNKFLGPLAQGNYWRKTYSAIVDEFPVLQSWSVSHFGVVSCNDDILQSQLTERDLKGLRKWVHLYISECERIIVDFRDILRNSNLSPAATQLLLEPFSSG
jgi:CheY-like chemotaxis protein